MGAYEDHSRKWLVPVTDAYFDLFPEGVRLRELRLCYKVPLRAIKYRCQKSLLPTKVSSEETQFSSSFSLFCTKFISLLELLLKVLLQGLDTEILLKLA